MEIKTGTMVQQYKVSWELEVEAYNQMQAIELALQDIRDENAIQYVSVTTLATGKTVTVEASSMEIVKLATEEDLEGIEFTAEELEELRRLFDEDL